MISLILRTFDSCPPGASDLLTSVMTPTFNLTPSVTFLVGQGRQQYMEAVWIGGGSGCFDYLILTFSFD